MKTLKASVEGDWETLYIHTLPKRAQYKQTKGSLKKPLRLFSDSYRNILEYVRTLRNFDDAWFRIAAEIAVNLFQFVMLIIIIRK